MKNINLILLICLIAISTSLAQQSTYKIIGTIHRESPEIDSLIPADGGLTLMDYPGRFGQK